MSVKQALFTCVLFLLVAGCSSNDSEVTTEEAANNVIDLLLEEDYKKIHDAWFDEELQKTMSEADLKKLWKQGESAVEAFQVIESLYISERGEDLAVAEAELEYAAGTIELRMIFNENRQLRGVSITDVIVITDPPENVIEEEVVVGADTEFPLQGLLTLPKDTQTNLPAVVFVHGSGPSDRDAAVLGYKPFRDLAWGLAEQGIASVRYDKRTLTYGNELAELSREITVYEESVEDAILATENLRSDKRINEEQVYLIGHSLGGMLAPRIDAEGGDYAGLVILAGTPRPLWEVVYDQNLAVIDELSDEEVDKDEQLEIIEIEYNKAESLADISEEEAGEMTVFGMNGLYLKEMDEYPVETLVGELDKPLLVLQGEDDFQVYYEKDFPIWEENLEGNTQATLKSYAGLNHFFIEYEGPLKGTIAEYEVEKEVEQEVVEDIGNWIVKQN